ncbi:rRNA adenine N-6-methyltransferase family protein [Raoultella ornithinolytica]|uniref:rRNA adenine N-6-methyltransferase family protein n=1 Tax=Raoultella ornithinolytica TaxID=54291 RepID=UPI001D1182E2|nr:rRNA adenine N-6-methyltransferase family protein [Raoultella ornithinolytica]
MSILTKEGIQKILNDDWLLMDDCEGLENCTVIKELARMALAAMDSEPVIVVGDDGGDALSYRRLIQSFEPGTKLYRHAQPAPVVPEEKSIPNTLSMYAVDAVAAIAEVKGWNACRAAMLQELKKSAGTEAICRSDENVQVLHTKSPAQSDCCPAQNVVVPAQSPIDHGYLPECECSGCKATARICTEMAVNSPAIPDGYVMVPKEPTQAMCAAFNDSDYGRKSLRERYVAMLAAAPQEVK